MIRLLLAMVIVAALGGCGTDDSKSLSRAQLLCKDVRASVGTIKHRPTDADEAAFCDCVNESVPEPEKAAAIAKAQGIRPKAEDWGSYNSFHREKAKAACESKLTPPEPGPPK